MKTKGINTSEDVEKFRRDENIEHDAEQELWLKSMMISCFAYGGIEKTSFNYERYIKEYEERLGEEIFNEVYEEQAEFLNKNYTVEINVYTDSEGLTYNKLNKI
jgi:hypothetical protein